MESSESEKKKPATRSRLMIQQLVLENFKSYAGKKTIGPFHKCFSAIVGPNGSGKSNVIDAMLFVFGKRASKLRLKKVSELIHNSSENPNCQFARVTVHFQDIIDLEDGDGFEIVQDSQLEISRTAYKSNKSEYFVNGKKSAFSDVSKILEEKGIDLHNNRFLILQGEVEQISLMKPKAQNPHEEGLLEYLEDIIGSSKYVQEIEDKSSIVEKLSQERNVKLNRVKLVEKEKNSLEEAKLEAEEYVRKEREYLSKKYVEYRLKNFDAAQKLKTAAHARDSLQEKIEKLKQDGLVDKESLNSYSLKLKKAQTDYDKVTTAIKDKKKLFSTYEKKDIKLQENLRHLQRNISDLKSKLKLEQKKKEKEITQKKVSEKELPELEDIVKSAVKSKELEEDKLERFYSTLSDKFNPLRSELEAMQKELEPLIKDKLQRQIALEEVKTNIQIIENESHNNKEELEKASKELKEVVEYITKDPEEIENHRNLLRDLNSKEAIIRRDLNNLELEEKRLLESLQQYRIQLDSQKSSFASNNSQSALLQSLSEAKAGNGELSGAGLHMRLGSLGSIDAKYDIAVSTACPALDYLVTETTEGAEECVEFLRKRQLGRATFAILEKFKRFETQMQKKVSAPLPRLFDLIQVDDPKFQSAFYFAMRDTLVAENLDEAVRVAYKANKCIWRVVTLDGTLIDKAGTMSGGGKKAKSGLMNLLGKDNKAGFANRCAQFPTINKSEIQNLENEVQSKTKRLSYTRSKIRDMKLKMNAIEKEKDKLEEFLSTLEIRSTSSADRKTHLLARIEKLKDGCILSEESKAQLKHLKAREQAKTREYEIACGNAKKLESECDEIQMRIMNVGGEKMKKLKKAVENATIAVDNVSAKLNTRKFAIKASEAKIKSFEQSINNMNKELNELENDRKNLQENNKSSEDVALRVMEELDLLSKEQSREMVKLEEIKSGYSMLKNKFGQHEKSMVELQNRLEIEEDEVKLCEERVDTWSKKLDEVFRKFKRLPSLENTPKSETSFTCDLNNISQVSDEELEKQIQNKNEFLNEIDQLKIEVDRLKKNINMGAINEYKTRESEYNERAQELDEATKIRDEAREDCENLRKMRLECFMEGFALITLKLKEMYQMITMGGDAELELVDSLDPFSEGIVFSVRPPKKSWKNISNLSGGEKTLSSLALIFALHHYNPTPLYVMDEIDAALDFKNVSIVANYIKERTKNAQFIIISLRNNMFELADRLVGIYKTKNATKSITINPTQILEKQKVLRQQKIMHDRTNEILK